MMHMRYTLDAQNVSWHIAMTTTLKSSLKLIHWRSDPSKNSEWQQDWVSDGNDTDSSDGVVFLGSLVAEETDPRDSVLNTVPQQPRNNEGDRVQITSTAIAEEVIDLTRDDITEDAHGSGDVLPPFGMAVRIKKENSSSCYVGNSCDADEEINPDPHAAGACEL